MREKSPHFYYWLLPSLLIGACMAIYFFDIFGLSYVIAPDFNREFGLLEHIQLLFLLGIVYVGVRSLIKAKQRIQRIIFGVLIVGGLFIFLEELDYGLHYVEYLTNKAPHQSQGSIRNIHNQGNITYYMKVAAYLTLGLLALFPILFKKYKIKHELIATLMPPIYFVYSIIAMIVLNRLALYIDVNLKADYITSLNSNVSEFEETFIYYIALLYVTTKSNLLLQLGKEQSE